MDRVSLTYSDHIAHVTLTRADKMNAVDDAMIKGLIAAGEEIIASDARAVVISGEGRAFCAGLDVMSFAAMAGTNPEDLIMPRSHGDANQWQEVALIWRRVPVPVIAALHGVCFGAGMQIATGADIRIAAPDTRLSIMEMKWGLVPDMGGMVIWPQMLRSDVLRQLTYTAQEIDAAQARDWGLVTSLADDPLAEARALAATIAGKSPSAVRAAKRLIAVAESGATAAEILHAESREQADLVGRPHQMEVIAAQMGKRAPVFK